MDTTNPLEAVLTSKRLFEEVDTDVPMHYREPGQPQPKQSAFNGANAALNNLMRLGILDEWFEKYFVNQAELLRLVEKHLPNITKSIEDIKKI